VRLERLVFANFPPTTLPEDIWERARNCTDELVLISADPPEYRSVVEDADWLILRLGTAADAEFLAGATKVRYVGVLGTDYARIGVAAARQHGIVATNIADYSTTSVAEFALGTTLDLFRNLAPEQHRAATGDLTETTFIGRERSALRVGVVGAGNLGRHVARIMARGVGASGPR